MHSQFASHRPSPPTRADAHASRAARPGVSAAATVPAGAVPRRAAVAAASFLPAGAPGRVPLSLTVVIIAGPGLMPPAPLRPVQEARHAPHCRSPELPEQPADFGPTQVDRS